MNLDALEKELAAEALAEAAAAAPPTPAKWFAAKFPKLPEMYGDAVQEDVAEKDGKPLTVKVRGLSEDFLAATFGEAGTPDTPTVFVAIEKPVLFVSF